MPKRARELSARAVMSLREEGRYAVGGVPGLYLRIEDGYRCWVLRHQVNGKRQEFGLGGFPQVTLAQARDRAWERRRNRPSGSASPQLPPTAPQPRALVPSAQPNPPTPGTAKDGPPVTFRFCARTYIAAQQAGWKSPKHSKQWSSTLEEYAHPVIGHLHPREITLAHLLRILQPIWASKTETATRVRGRIESILDWAEHRSYRSGKNPAAWNGNLEFELPSPTKLKKRKKRHHPALPYLRVGAFMADLRARQGVSIRALEWGILTAARSQEIRGARHSEINLQLKRWTIPKERMKLEKDHVVPLSEAAISLYERLPVRPGCDLLFPAPESGGELTDAALSELIDGMHEGDLKRGGIGYLDPVQDRVATPHGFRSTFRDWAAEVAFFPREVIEHALAHKLKDAAEAAYQRGVLLAKRAALMEQWAAFCSELCPQLPSLRDISERTAA